MELRGALTLFSFDTGRYPTSTEGLNALVHNTGQMELWRGPYIGDGKVPVDPWNRPYAYKCPGEHGAYDLLSYGGDGLQGGRGLDQDIHVRHE